MEDYKISPDVVARCAKEISEECGGGLQREGKTLHCLMDLARPHRKGDGHKMEQVLSDACRVEVC